MNNLKASTYLTHFEDNLKSVKDRIESLDISRKRLRKEIGDKETSIETYTHRLVGLQRVKDLLNTIISNEIFKLRDEQGLLD